MVEYLDLEFMEKKYDRLSDYIKFFIHLKPYHQIPLIMFHRLD